MPIRNVSAHFGPRRPAMQFGGDTVQDLKQIAVWQFNFNELPTPGLSNLEHVIPTGSTILNARLRIITAFVSSSTTTDLDIGLQTSAGVEIDNDGLITVAQATQATIGVAGAIIDGSSGTPAALVGKIVSGNGELKVTPNVNDLTAGVGQVIVEYLLPAALPAA